VTETIKYDHIARRVVLINELKCVVNKVQKEVAF
jgi:hypothetical protein